MWVMVYSTYSKLPLLATFLCSVHLYESLDIEKSTDTKYSTTTILAVLYFDYWQRSTIIADCPLIIDDLIHSTG